MFVVMFEVQPRKDHFDDYLDLAKQLRPKLEAIDGFIDNERFSSERTAGRLLSLSTWRDEKAVVRWRTHGEHHGVQETGRFRVFEDYHIRVGEVTSDSAPPPGLAMDEQRFDETAVSDAKLCTITEFSPLDTATPDRPIDLLSNRIKFNTHVDGLLDHELYESITNHGKLLLLASWRDKSAAVAWNPVRPEGMGDIRHRGIRVIRDYGMFDRREAPQFYPDIAATSRHSNRTFARQN